ncbi:MAG: cell division protein ZapE [Geminicoccaceae bacterium]
MADTAALPDGPYHAYADRLAQGELSEDPLQAKAMAALDALEARLRAFDPSDPTPRKGLLGRIGLKRAPETVDAPQGLYIHGPVGRGKSMLTDLFFATSQVEAKRRVHFHAFMLEVHKRLHRLRQDGGVRDPIQPLADELIADAWLLCFDEFHVTNIVDAMLLGRLFTALFERGLVMVATSNWPPDRLYEGGLQRHLFIPFIDLLKVKTESLSLAGERDYRQGRLQGRTVYHFPIGMAASRAINDAFNVLTEDAETGPDEVRVGTRRLSVPMAGAGVARFDFEDLCARALGAADYLALAERFHTLILENVPILGPHNRNEARRFINLIDALYENHRRLIVSAEAPPQRLYPEGDGAFEFERTVSRLMEMQSRRYLEAVEENLEPSKKRSFEPLV